MGWLWFSCLLWLRASPSSMLPVDPLLMLTLFLVVPVHTPERLLTILMHPASRSSCAPWGWSTEMKASDGSSYSSPLFKKTKRAPLVVHVIFDCSQRISKPLDAACTLPDHVFFSAAVSASSPSLLKSFRPNLFTSNAPTSSSKQDAWPSNHCVFVLPHTSAPLMEQTSSGGPRWYPTGGTLNNHFGVNNPSRPTPFHLWRILMQATPRAQFLKRITSHIDLVSSLERSRHSHRSSRVTYSWSSLRCVKSIGNV